MYDIERQNKILEILREKKSVSVNKLAEMLFASGATIRRDLSKMEQKGLVIRTFGAVMINTAPSNREVSFELREKTNIIEKRMLCQKAVDFIKNNSTIFIDSSTTLLHIVPYLNNFVNLTIITNGLFLANSLINNTKHNVIVLGGTIQPSTNSILGSMAIQSVSRFHADTCLISCSGIDLEFGLSELTIDSAELKKYMVLNANEVICLADSTKFNKRSLVKSCDISDIDILICSKEFTEEETKFIKQHKTKIVK